MRYVFFGTPRFAAIILEKLIGAGMPPVALVCNPDRPVGRKQIITSPPVKQLIADRKVQIEILQPEDILTIRDMLFALRPDFSVVAAYAKILPKEILEIPKLGTIGVHPSLLPKYRGPSPIQSVILADEKETGVSLFLMDGKVDHGPVISHQTLVINDEDDYEALEEGLARLAADLLVETLPNFAEGKMTPLPQDEPQATYSKKFTSEDAFIAPEDLELATSGASPEKAIEIHRKTRALNPEPGVWTTKNGKRFKLLETRLQNYKLLLKRIQEAGKKPIELAAVRLEE
ncbi:MAG: methionyl-tRNA formyltransferase [Candidatus Colwellbacteria bacterium]|nr:methionyl-tRNA formyltransferase [Candidatus Colwellbacteria bacterium]